MDDNVYTQKKQKQIHIQIHIYIHKYNDIFNHIEIYAPLDSTTIWSHQYCEMKF